MNKKKKIVKITIVILIIFLLILFFTKVANLIDTSNDVFFVENGTLSYEEQVDGIIIREEQILKGTSSNGVEQIITDGKRVSKGEPVFRYYSNNEEEIVKQIEEIDKQIDVSLDEIKNPPHSADIDNLKIQIEKNLYNVQNENEIQKIEEINKVICNDIIKKAEITGKNSPENSKIRQLIKKRNELNESLSKNSEIVHSPLAGVVSYKIDGLEEILVNDNFDYLTKEKIEEFDLHVGSSIPESKEQVKIVNNFKCYIACVMTSENAGVAEIGDKVTLRLPDSSEAQAEIVYTKDEKDDKILVFKINRNIEKLLEYRKISIEVIWWKYSGLKVSNKALKEKDGLTYVTIEKAGIRREVLVKVLRQNDTYSIVGNYEDEELEELGFSVGEIQKMKKIKLYDQVVIKNVT